MSHFYRQLEICRKLVSVWLSKQYKCSQYPLHHQVRTRPPVAGARLTSNSTACQPIENAIEFDSLNAAAATYSYCALMSAVSVPKCNACLSQQTDQFYINNCMSSVSVM
jgi:hypothetical protein